MASQHKVVFNFRPSLNVTATANSSNGWSETFYRLAMEEDSEAITAAQTFLAFRLAQLTPGWRCNKIRAYRWPLSRASTPFTPLAGDQQGQYSSATQRVSPSAKDEQPYDVLIVNLSSASGRNRAWGMRGIGSDVVDAGASYLAPATFEINNLDLLRTMLNGGWAIRTQAAGPQNAVYQALLAGVADGLTGTPFSPVLGVTGVPAPLVAGDKIRVSGVLGFSGLNGVWTVLTAHAPLIVGGSQVIQLMAKRGRQILGTYVGAGHVTALTYDLSQIKGLAPSSGSSHRVGGLPGRLRGRRRRPV